MGLLSLSLSIVFILIVISVINPGFASSALAISLVVIGLVDRVRPEWLDIVCLKWSGMDRLVHWSLLFFEVSIILYIIFDFIKNFEIKIVHREQKTEPTR